jgi:hypothetical protein
MAAGDDFSIVDGRQPDRKIEIGWSSVYLWIVTEKATA